MVRWWYSCINRTTCSCTAAQSTCSRIHANNPCGTLKQSHQAGCYTRGHTCRTQTTNVLDTAACAERTGRQRKKETAALRQTCTPKTCSACEFAANLQTRTDRDKWALAFQSVSRAQLRKRCAARHGCHRRLMIICKVLTYCPQRAPARRLA